MALLSLPPPNGGNSPSSFFWGGWGFRPKHEAWASPLQPEPQTVNQAIGQRPTHRRSSTQRDPSGPSTCCCFSATTVRRSSRRVSVRAQGPKGDPEYHEPPALKKKGAGSHKYGRPLSKTRGVSQISWASSQKESERQLWATRVLETPNIMRGFLFYLEDQPKGVRVRPQEETYPSKACACGNENAKHATTLL